MINRKPVVAGRYYERYFDKLDKQINSCFTSDKGPGETPSTRKEQKIFGAIVPHAGYSFSGQCAAWAYKEIAESKFPTTYVILGPNHTGEGADFSTYLFSDWETPFGNVKIDKELGNKLLKIFPDLTNEAEAHLHEHSIEVQLPFLQFASKDNLDKLKFLPICIKNNNYEKLMQLAKALSECEDICVICSSDFTHYGQVYNFVPFIHSKKENLYDMDAKAINYIKELNTEEFFKYAKTTTICGQASITVLVEYCKLMNAKAHLLSYYTSGDVLHDYDNAVGYASIIFK